MITSEKDWPRYNYKCHCGKQLCFMSNNPPCSVVDAICECYRLNPFITPIDSTAKYRYRTQPKTEKIRSNIISTFAEIKRQMTVRQVYYRLVIGGIVDKTDRGYDQVQAQLLKMRREGLIPYTLISDPSRRWYQMESHNSIENAVNGWLHNYRLDIWKDKDTHVEIWLEKEALGGYLPRSPIDLMYRYL